MLHYEKNKSMESNKKRTNKYSIVAGMVSSAENFEKKLSSLDINTTPASELKHKDFMLNKGIEFAYEDYKLEGIENAPEEYKNAVFFAKGYQIGLRRIRALGYDHYQSGMSLEEAELHNHLAFIEGYNSGISMEKSHKHK